MLGTHLNSIHFKMQIAHSEIQDIDITVILQSRSYSFWNIILC
jgi:hypothetical protein